MPELVPRVVLDMVARGEARREWRTLALFADVSGFTAMTETLASHGAEGAELLADALRTYFDPMLALVQEAGGLVTGFAGDAFTTLFPDDDGPQAVDAALLVAASMRDFFLQHPVHSTRFGDFPFGLKLGLCSDLITCEVVRGQSDRHVAYFRGPAIDRAAAAEQTARKGEVVLAPEILRRARGWSVAGGLRSDHQSAPRTEFPDGVPSAGLRGEALFVPRSALGFPTEGEFRDVVPVFFSFDEGCDAAALARLLLDELLRFGDGALRVEFGDKGGVAWTFFGAPVAFEDQADRALAFARSVVARSPGGVRAGVTRGVAYAGFLGGRARAEFTCLGRAVNLAARLMARAPAGEVWCSRALRERARLHDFVPRGELLLKGFSRPVEAFQAVRRASPAPPPSTSLVARESELDRLEALVQGALDGASPGVVYLDGDAGLGKTALLSALRGRLLARGDEAPVVLWGGCRSLGGQPLAPLREALWGERDVLGEHPAEEISGALSLLASWGPVVLLLDDAAQIDALSLALLRGLLQSGLALAVVLAVRPDDRGHFLRFELDLQAASLELLPFDEAALEGLLALLLGAPPTPALLEVVSHASGGNPLLATELAAKLREKSSFDPTAGLLPEEVIPLLVSRLDRLSVNVRRTVQVASVLGASLDAESLLELMARQPRVLDYVRLATKARVWTCDNGRIVFRSGMLRDAAAQMLPRARLRRLLREAAEVHERGARIHDALRAIDQLLGLLPQGPERLRVEAWRQTLASRQS